MAARPEVTPAALKPATEPAADTAPIEPPTPQRSPTTPAILLYLPFPYQPLDKYD